MICAKFTRLEDGYKVDAEWQGYGNANIFEAFKMENIDLKKILDDMKIGEVKVYNIGWWNCCGNDIMEECEKQMEYIEEAKRINKDTLYNAFVDIRKMIQNVL